MSSTPAPPIIRKSPIRTVDKWKAWHFWSAYWNWVHIIVGGLSAGIAALVAANTKAKFISEPWDWIVAVVAAVLTFMVNGLAAQAKGAAFETAGRELEKGMVDYELKPTTTEADLADAEKRGVDILNRVKPS